MYLFVVKYIKLVEMFSSVVCGAFYFELAFHREPKTRTATMRNIVFSREPDRLGANWWNTCFRNKGLHEHVDKWQRQGTGDLALLWAGCTMCVASAVGWKSS